jgi:hypothetical protein
MATSLGMALVLFLATDDEPRAVDGRSALTLGAVLRAPWLPPRRVLLNRLGSADDERVATRERPGPDDYRDGGAQVEAVDVEQVAEDEVSLRRGVGVRGEEIGASLVVRRGSVGGKGRGDRGEGE